MSGTVIADFTAQAVFAGTRSRDPVRSRVLLGEDRLVVASRDARTTVPLSAILDATVGQVPKDLAGFVDQSVRVTYREDDRRRTLVVQGGHETLDKFVVRLYRQLLRGAQGCVRHPAKRGGRLTEGDFSDAAVLPGTDAVTVRGRDGEFEIDLDAVTAVTRARRTVRDEPAEVVCVRHWDGEKALTTEVTFDEARLRTLLARAVRLRLHEVEDELADETLDDDAERALVALYAGASPDACPTILDADPETVAPLLSDLERRGLVADADASALTPVGRLAVANYYASTPG